jgi:hypothetical protein
VERKLLCSVLYGCGQDSSEEYFWSEIKERETDFRGLDDCVDVMLKKDGYHFNLHLGILVILYLILLRKMSAYP